MQPPPTAKVPRKEGLTAALEDKKTEFETKVEVETTTLIASKDTIAPPQAEEQVGESHRAELLLKTEFVTYR
jgi:hypothetical protein